jgi:hypothetical protein
MAYHILQRQQNYQELGADYFDRLTADAIRRTTSPTRVMRIFE